jgi:hypothetical protein
MDAPLVFSAGDGPAPEATTGSALASQIAAQVLRPADAATAAMSSAVTSSAPPAPAIPDDPYAAYYGEAPQNGGVGSIYKESTDSTSAVNYALIN